MRTQKNLLIGGPGSGKTSVINHLSEKGHYCLPEISRQVTLSAQTQGISQLFLSDPLLFSKKLLEGRIAQYKEAENTKKHRVFIDRGIPDVSAYLDYKGENYPDFFEEANQKYHYDRVFIFPIWEKIYVSDNERYESLVAAKKIQHYLKNTYKNLGYHLIEVPIASVEERAVFIEKNAL